MTLKMFASGLSMSKSVWQSEPVCWEMFPGPEQWQISDFRKFAVDPWILWLTSKTLRKERVRTEPESKEDDDHAAHVTTAMSQLVSSHLHGRLHGGARADRDAPEVTL